MSAKLAKRRYSEDIGCIILKNAEYNSKESIFFGLLNYADFHLVLVLFLFIAHLRY
jgi:hypothetical protein